MLGVPGHQDLVPGASGAQRAGRQDQASPSGPSAPRGSPRAPVEPMIGCATKLGVPNFRSDIAS